jgi:hypothetical protein
MSHVPTSDAGWIDLASTELTVEQKIRVEALNAAVGALAEVFGAPNGAELLDLAAEFEAYIRDGRS